MTSGFLPATPSHVAGLAPSCRAGCVISMATSATLATPGLLAPNLHPMVGSHDRRLSGSSESRLMLDRSPPVRLPRERERLASAKMHVPETCDEASVGGLAQMAVEVTRVKPAKARGLVRACCKPSSSVRPIRWHSIRMHRRWHWLVLNGLPASNSTQRDASRCAAALASARRPLQMALSALELQCGGRSDYLDLRINFTNPNFLSIFLIFTCWMSVSCPYIHEGFHCAGD